MPAYVYLLKHASEPRFKIGKADNLAARILQLGVRQFKLADCRALEVTDTAAAMNLERALHRMFRAYRLAPGGQAPTDCPSLRDRQNGDTEYFSMDCWDRLMTFLAQNKDLLIHTMLPPAEVKNQVNAAIPIKACEERRLLARQSYLWHRHREFQLQEESLSCQAWNLGTALAELSATSEFTAVVRLEDCYALVGKLPKRVGIRALTANLKPFIRKATSAVAHARGWFVMELLGTPGQPATEAPDAQSWFERLVWSHEPCIQGFDMPLSLQAGQQAASVFKELKKPYG